ncbi:hypothetical protein [Paracoccus hibiscisoli]|uniref:Uncharacterized protein n=1 Tax=Paracoccus hibiscisoli TaxID=2023261 RepID=A0A4U0QUN4_9RHOB|nr:hypothetical protein [Paracoccus hibiscisoli]TJZ85849.1 hypothetical protein FA740_05460 [Paracoccus hibiscisoli]
MDRLIDIMGPLLLSYLPALIDAVLAPALLAAAGFAARKWQIQIADAHIQKAHQALKTAALAGLRKGLTGTRLEAFIQDQARASSPTAMSKLEAKATGPVLQNIILSKIEDASHDALSRALEKALPKPR